MRTYTFSILIATSTDCAKLFPQDFDPQSFPILAKHWFGIEPCLEVNDRRPSAAAEPVVDLSVIRLGEAPYRLGVSLGTDAGSRNDVLKQVKAVS